jgi:ferredoxin
MTTDLDAALHPLGLFVRGGFRYAADDAPDGLPADAPSAGTLVLVGNAGAAMWDAFARNADRGVRHPLDGWLRPALERIASDAGATALFPNDGPPFVPLHDWAMRAEPVHRSPIGILIHPEYGLWHVYRAAFLFDRDVALPPRAETPSPCDGCARKPCLTVCPADAFRPDRFDAEACAGHVESADGAACRDRGCLARRACPVGRNYLYPPEQQAFHTAAMVRAVRKGFGE